MKQKTLQERYILLKEGKTASSDFLRESKRQFPNLLTNITSLKDAETILKNKGIINEGYINLKPIGQYESKPAESWEESFRNFLKEEKEDVKADTDKFSKYVEETQSHNWDFKDKKNINNVSFQQLLSGMYSEYQIEKNCEKTLEEVQKIVEKNLANDPLYYIKKHSFGVEGVGYEEMWEVIEAKGKHKDSGYGDLDKEAKARINEGYSFNKGLMNMINENDGDFEDSNPSDRDSIKDKILQWFDESEENDEEMRKSIENQLNSSTEVTPETFELIWSDFIEKYGSGDVGADWEYFDETRDWVFGKETLDENSGQGDDDEMIYEWTEDKTGLLVTVEPEDVESFEIWLDQSAFYAEKERNGVYFFPETPENFDSLEKFLQIEMAAEDLSVQFEAQDLEENYHEEDPTDGDLDSEYTDIAEKFIPHVELHENKNMNIQKRLKEIEQVGAIAAMEAKINAIQEEIDSRQEKISTVSENEALADFVNTGQIKAIEKEIKMLEKEKAKFEKIFAKAGKNPSKPAVNDVKDDVETDGMEPVNEESKFATDDERYYEELDDDAYGRTYDEMDYDDEDNEWVDENEFKGGDHDFKNFPTDEYTSGDKIDFLSQVNYPEEKDVKKFANLDRLSEQAVSNLFESYFPGRAKKIIKG